MPDKPRWRFTLAGLMPIMAYVCLTCAVVATNSARLLTVHFTFTVGILLFAICGLCCTKGDARRFWIGYVVMSWGFFVMSLFPSIPGTMQRYLPAWEMIDWIRAIRGQIPGSFPLLSTVCSGFVSVVAGFIGGALTSYSFAEKEDLAGK